MNIKKSITRMDINSFFLSLLLLLLSACACKNDPWRLNQIESSLSSSSRLTYKDKNLHSGLELEFISKDNTLFGFINISSGKIPYYDKKNALVKIDIENHPHVQLETLLSGQQKIYLSPKSINLIISSLLDNKDVTIILDQYESIIPASFFRKKFDKATHSSHNFFEYFPQINFLPS